MRKRPNFPAGVAIYDRHGRPLLRLGRTPGTASRGARTDGEDALTGLPDLAAFLRALERELARIGRGGDDGCVAVLDLDDFKLINDRHGHHAGDDALRQVGQVLRSGQRSGDMAARLGADEFAILLPATDLADARSAVQRLLDAIAAVEVAPGDRLSASAGVATTNLPERGGSQPIDAATLLGFADNAMYFAKARQPGSVVPARRGLQKELRSERARLTEEARIDGRTGLPTSRTFEAEVRRIHDQAGAAGTTYGLLIADIDHFHEYNRVHGMLAGNEALLAVATALDRALPDAIAYRYGGEEFTLLLPNARSRASVDAAGEQVNAAVRGLALPHLGRPTAPPVVTVTVAGALVEPNVEHPNEGLDRADRALVGGKAAGRDRYVPADPPQP